MVMRNHRPMSWGVLSLYCFCFKQDIIVKDTKHLGYGKILEYESIV